MITKQKIWDYLNESPSHSRHTASLHFGIEIEEVYKIMGEKDE